MLHNSTILLILVLCTVIARTPNNHQTTPSLVQLLQQTPPAIGESLHSAHAKIADTHFEQKALVAACQFLPPEQILSHLNCVIRALESHSPIRINTAKLQIVSGIGSASPTKGPSYPALFLRLTKLSLLFAPTLSLSPLAYVSSSFRKAVYYPLLASTLKFSGPAFVKWGQWASTRR